MLVIGAKPKDKNKKIWPMTTEKNSPTGLYK